MSEQKIVIPNPQRYHVVIGHDFDTGGHTWGQSIFVPFHPDEVILRSISYVSPEVEPYAYVLQCINLGEPMVTFTNGSTYCPLTVFDLRGKTVNTTWQFQLQVISGIPTAMSAGRLAFLLEFIKH